MNMRNKSFYDLMQIFKPFIEAPYDLNLELHSLNSLNA